MDEQSKNATVRRFSDLLCSWMRSWELYSDEEESRLRSVILNIVNGREKKNRLKIFSTARKLVKLSVLNQGMLITQQNDVVLLVLC